MNVTSTYPDLFLKPGREKALINRHPWIFSGAVNVAPNCREGEIVAVRNMKNEVLAYGFYSRKSQIVCRLFEFTEKLMIFDDAYWKQKIQNAYNYRKNLPSINQSNAWRLVHAEGDFLPGLIADVYGETVVVQLLTEGTILLKDTLLNVFTDLGFRYVYVKDADENKDRSYWLGNIGDKVIEMEENGLKMLVNIEEGQKTGTFLDQRDNRQLLGTYAKGRSVLNAFSYSGGFSLHALKNGAKIVHSVDISKRAIELANENVELNFGQTAKHQGIVADCFDYLRQPRSNYDLIILDPPAFAKNLAAVERAARGYKDINLQAFKMIQPGGFVFTFSCSQKITTDLFRKIVFSAASDANRNIRIVHQLTQPADHPVNIYHPEGEYLKGLVLHVE
jgi:23S rRNA (cytosine1962-C5)-methyltransferase